MDREAPMTDIIGRLQAAMHEESALHAPRTTNAIEAMRAAQEEIARLRAALTEAESALCGAAQYDSDPAWDAAEKARRALEDR